MPVSQVLCSFEQGPGSYPSNLEHRQSQKITSCISDYTDMPCQSNEDIQVMVLQARDFDHCDLKKEDGNLRRQKVSNVNSAAAVR